MDGRIYVLKQVTINALDVKQQQAAVTEVQLLASLDNCFIVRYFDSFIDGGMLNIVMEYCQHGDMHQFIKVG